MDYTIGRSNIHRIGINESSHGLLDVSLSNSLGISIYIPASPDSNCVAYTAGLAGTEYATSLQIFAAITISSGGTFIPTAGQI